MAKTDPETYSVDDLERERRTVWDGVKNPQALRAIAAMQPGDRVFLYHSMGEAAVMAVAKVASEPRPDPRHPRLTVVDLEFLRRLRTPVTLREIKESGKFNDWSLVRQSRLSTMAAPESFVEWLREKGEKV